MSNRRGRCFRDARRTRARKARQGVAFAAFMSKFPNAKMPGFPGMVAPRLEMLNEIGKQQLAENHRRGFKAQFFRRGVA